MAYLIVDNESNLYKIAANDTDKNNLNCTFPPYSTIDISDVDFLKIKQNLVNVSISNGSVTFRDADNLNSSLTEEFLRSYHKLIINSIDNFLIHNTSNPFYTQCKNYRDYLQTLNYLNLTLPIIGKTWEQYCEENSISYLHTLQIP